MTDSKAEKMYTYLRGYAEGGHMKNTMVALPFSRKHHSGQTRNDGKPYIYHPLVIACYAISLEIADDTLLAKEKWPDMNNLIFILKENLKQTNGILHAVYAKEVEEYMEQVKEL